MNTSVIAFLDALLLATLVGTCAGGVAIVVAVAAKRWPASGRHHVLLVAGAVSVVSLVSAAATNASRTQCVLLQCDAHTDDVAARDRRLEVFSWLAAAKYPGDTKPITDLKQEDPAGTLARSILLLWLAGVSWSAARAIHTSRIVARMLQRAQPFTDRWTHERVDSLSRRMGVSKPIALRSSSELPVAAVVGNYRKTLLLPSGFAHLSAERAEMVLVHELAHIVRGDRASMVCGQVLTTLFWFNPIAHWCATQMRDLQEVAADSAVLALGYRASSYAELLLDTLRDLGGVASVSAPIHSFIGRGLIRTRLRTILDPRTPHDTPLGLARNLLRGSVVAAVLAAAAMPVGIHTLRAQQQLQFNRSLLNEKSLDSLIRPAIRNAMTDARVAGAAVSIVHDGTVIYTGSFGERDVMVGLAVDPARTIWRIGSITKVVTGIAVMQLVDKGLLDLNAEVNQYLTAFRIPERFSDPVRVRHLLTHTAGFDQIGLGRHVASAQARRPLGEFLKQYLNPIREPGVVSAYDTYAITLAGYLVEQLSGLTFEQYLITNIFEPLKMYRSGILVPPALAIDVATGYEFAGTWEAQKWEFMNTDPASTVNSTVSDMARLMMMMLGGGELDGVRILSPQAARAMLTQQFANHPEQPGYGYTLFEDRSFGLNAFSHGGSMTGFGSMLYLLPEQRLGVFIAVNQESGRVQSAVLSAVLSGLFPGRARSLPKRPVVPQPTPVSHFTGRYANNMYHHADPTGAGWRMRPFELGVDSTGRLLFEGVSASQVGPLTFQRDDGVLITFREDAQGEVTHMFVSQSVFERLR